MAPYRNVTEQVDSPLGFVPLDGSDLPTTDPYKIAVRALLGQRWTDEQARKLHDLIIIGSHPLREHTW